jgi:thymidylate synthase
MKVYKGETFAEVYRSSLTDLLNNPEFETKPRSLKIKENCNVSLIIKNPLSCLFKNETRSSQKKYIAAELLWYFMGRNDAGFISNFAKFWNIIKNEDDTVNSSYGHLLFNKKNRYGSTQIEWAINSLLEDKDSRQAIIHLNLPEHQYPNNKDFVCTMYGIFQIRDNKLNFTISMRSNDVVWGLPTDIAFFAILQSQVLSHLKKKYPILELGTYTHIANSFHIYENHYDVAENMILTDFIPEAIPKVSSDLITKEGHSTSSLVTLFNNYKDYSSLFNDPLFKWINEHIN